MTRLSQRRLKGDAPDAQPGPRAGYLCAMLLARIDEVFPLLCPRCSAPMRIIAFITEAGSIQRIYGLHPVCKVRTVYGEEGRLHVSSNTSVSPSTPRASPPARGPPDWERDFDTREGETFGLSEYLPEYEFDQRVSE